MSWTKLLASKIVTPLPATKEELDNLRSLVARSLKDVEVTGLSTDMRFILAYDAARTLSLMVVRATGYRPKAVGGHYNTFLALRDADPTFATLSAYFDGCRIKRNASEYDFAGGVSDTDADGLLNAVKQFATAAEAWIKPTIRRWPEAWSRGKTALSNLTLFTRYPDCRTRTVVARLHDESKLAAGGVWFSKTQKATAPRPACCTSWAQIGLRTSMRRRRAS